MQVGKHKDIMKHTTRKFSLNLGRLFLLTVAVLAPTAAAEAQSYSITDLGGLPGATATVAWGINDNGTVAGWSGTAALNTGFIWSGGVMKNIGSLPGGNPGSGLFAINGLGQAVGVANPGNIQGLLQTQGILYRNNTMLTIDTSASSLYAHYITDTGVIVGDYLKGGGSSGTIIPAFWTEDPTKPGRFRRTDLVPVAGDTAAYANAANQSLIIVGTTASQFRGNQGCIWNNDAKHTPSTLAPVPGDQTAVAEGVNNLGAACGFSWFGTYRTNAVVWSADASHTPTALPLLPGTTHGWARAINNLGQVIGYGGDASGAGGTLQTTGATPVIWLNGQIYTLQSVLDASGAGWSNVEGVAINNAGQIAGNGIHNGVPSGFIMTPNVGP